jgi:hypothetical protein
VARLYSDENFPMPVVEELRQLGHDVVSIQERGRASEGTPDEEVLKLAIAEDRAVLTIAIARTSSGCTRKIQSTQASSFAPTILTIRSKRGGFTISSKRARICMDSCFE